MDDEIKVGTLRRDLAGAEFAITREKDATRMTFPASSEVPVERFFGNEVLSHEPGSIRMERFKRAAVPLLFNHNWDDPVGMVTGARVEKNRLVVDAEMFATQRAGEVEKMMAGGLRNVSIGYQVHTFEEDKRGNFTATDWEPLEVSIVTVPADATVGIGREAEKDLRSVRVVRAQVPPPAAPAALEGVSQMADNNAAAGAVAEVQVIDNGAQERLRIKTLQALGRTHKIDSDTVDQWVDSGVSAEEGAQKVLDVIAERSKRNLKDHPANLGLSDAEAKRFSITRAINAVIHKNWNNAGFEAEVSRTTAQRMGKVLSEHSFMIPLDVQRRTLIVGTSSQGGSLVGTNLEAGSFIELLRNRSVAMRMGARMLSGLTGSVAIPKQLTSGAVGWIGEVGTATANELTVGQLTLSPKHLSGYQEISRQLLLQSTPDAESLVNADLAAAMALGLDSAVLAGTSTNSTQPLGIRFTSGLGTANPTAGTAVTYADMIRFQSTVAASNAMFPNFGYVTRPEVAAILMGKPRFTNSDTPIWDGGILDGRMVGMPAMASLQLGTGTVLAGDFSQVIIGEWGTLEIEVNPYANFQAGIIGVRAFMTADVGVRYGAAFAIGTGITG